MPPKKRLKIKKKVKKKIISKKKIIKKKTLNKKSQKRKQIKKKPLFKKRRKIKTSFYLIKSEENPIIAPKKENNWECWQTFNPGVILLDDKVHFIYRAIGQDGISRFGYAMSEDGFKIKERLDYPVYSHHFQTPVFNFNSYSSGGSWLGCEDPRITRVENEDQLYMTYTAVGDGQLRVALTSIKVNNFLNKKWHWKKPVFISPPNQIHKNWVIFPEKINGYYAILHSLNPEVLVDYFENLDFDGKTFIQSYYGGKIEKNCWDSLIKGAGPPPIKTQYGWLLFYHAIDKNDANKYKAGAMILDLKDPRKLLLRSKTPILEPQEIYENNGYKPGIVYVSGAIVKNGDLLIYYGGADSYVCVASCNLKKFLEDLIRQIKPKLKKIKIKKKK